MSNGVRILLAGMVVVSSTATAFAQDARAKEIELLKREVEVLRRENEQLRNENEDLKEKLADSQKGAAPAAKGKAAKAGPPRNSLSAAVQPGAVFTGTFRSLNQKPPIDGNATLTINTRNGSKFTAHLKTTSPGKADFDRDVEGTLETPTSVVMESVNDPLPIRMAGSKRNNVLNLDFKGPRVTSVITLKLP